MSSLGLFPLKLVIFPDSLYPLHIFEERYKELINKCWDSGESFGIQLQDTSKLYDIGCTAIVANITKKYGDGRMDIIIRGEKRYRLLKMIETESKFSVGQITLLHDIHEDVNQSLLLLCLDQYNRIISSLNDPRMEVLRATQFRGTNPSYVLAQKSGLSVYQRQELLETDSENQRLELIYHHLLKVLPLAKEAEIINRIIKNDGYFQNNN